MYCMLNVLATVPDLRIDVLFEKECIMHVHCSCVGTHLVRVHVPG